MDSPDSYAKRLRAQGGVCAICGTAPRLLRRLSRDHCHRTGLDRDLLCSRCNTGLGLFLDNPQLLRRAADYLETHADPDAEPLELPTRVVRRKFAPPPANTDRLIDALTLAEQISQRIALSRKQQRRAEIQADLVQLGHTKLDRQRKPKRTGSD